MDAFTIASSGSHTVCRNSPFMTYTNYLHGSNRPNNSCRQLQSWTFIHRVDQLPGWYKIDSPIAALPNYIWRFLKARKQCHSCVISMPSRSKFPINLISVGWACGVLLTYEGPMSFKAWSFFSFIEGTPSPLTLHNECVEFQPEISSTKDIQSWSRTKVESA